MMNYLECFEKSKISDFRYDPECPFLYNFNPEIWWRPSIDSKYDMWGPVFSNYFLTLDSLEKIGGNGIFSVAHALDSMNECNWRQAIKRNFWKSKKINDARGIVFDSLYELGIPKEILINDKMLVWQFDPEAGMYDSIRRSAEGLNVVGIIYSNEFYPIWWDPFHYFLEE